LAAALPKSPVCLLGWSLGATVALAMAKNHPQQINSLILLAGNPRFVQDGDWPGMNPQFLDDFSINLSGNNQLMLVQFLALQVNGLSNGKQILKDLKRVMAECDPPAESVLQNGLKILKNMDLRECLVAVDCPISLIHGDKDTLIPVQVSQKMKKIQPTCEISVISGAGHVPFLSHESEVIEIINQFV